MAGVVTCRMRCGVRGAGEQAAESVLASVCSGVVDRSRAAFGYVNIPQWWGRNTLAAICGPVCRFASVWLGYPGPSRLSIADTNEMSFEFKGVVMEIQEDRVNAVLYKLAAAVNDPVAESVLTAVERLAPEDLPDMARRSLLVSVADGLGVSLV